MNREQRITELEILVSALMRGAQTLADRVTVLERVPHQTFPGAKPMPGTIDAAERDRLARQLATPPWPGRPPRPVGTLAGVEFYDTPTPPTATEES